MNMQGIFIDCFFLKSILFMPTVASNSEHKELFVIDWSQFVPTLIATFIAFCLTLFASYLYDKYKECVQKRVFIHDICRELDAMQTDLCTINDAMHNNKHQRPSLWLKPLKTYIWDSYIDGNNTYLISGEQWYEDLLAIYHIAREYNTWHGLRTDMILHNLSYSSIDVGIIELEKDIEKKINEIRVKMN